MVGGVEAGDGVLLVGASGVSPFDLVFEFEQLQSINHTTPLWAFVQLCVLPVLVLLDVLRQVNLFAVVGPLQ